MAIPLQGDGNFVTNVSKCTTLPPPIHYRINFTTILAHSNGTLHQTTRLKERNGYKYLEAIDTNITIEAGGVSSYLEGLFGGDKSLGK